MASPEGAIYRVGSLTLPFCPVSACRVSNPEGVISVEGHTPPQVQYIYPTLITDSTDSIELIRKTCGGV